MVTLRAAGGWEFLQAAARPSLWRVTLRRLPRPDKQRPPTVKLRLDPEQDDTGVAKDDTGDDPEIIELEAASQPARCAVSRAKNTLRMTWKNMDVGREKAVLDVTVACTLEPGDRFARFRAGFTYRGTAYTVFYLAAPLVDGIAGPPGDRERDFLATPCYTGRLIRNPAANGILGKPRRFQPNRSGHSMQFDAFYHAGNGLYLGCFDGAQNVKRYRLEASPEHGLGWAVVHVPDNMKQSPQTWAVPYDTVLGTFAGNWYDAARLYRAWALRQTWTAAGPLHGRASTPAWFKEIDEWMMWNFNKGPDGIVYAPLVQDVLDGCSVGLYASNFGSEKHRLVKTPDRFPITARDRKFIDCATRHGWPIMAYIQGICWDVESPSYRRLDGDRNTVQNFYGQRVVWDFTSRPHIGVLCAIAWPGKAWTEALGTALEHMARAGIRAAYLDSNNHAGTYLNFNPLYTNGGGGGNAYIKANQAMMAAVKKRARAIDPGFCISAESFWEGNMAQLDAYLTCNTTFQFLDRDVVTAIPLAQAVYHDYAIMYSAWVGRPDIEEQSGLGYVAKFGQTLVWGVKPGWNQPTFMLTFGNKEVATAFNRHRYRVYRAAKPFLLYGEMLRPPVLEKPAGSLRVKWHRGWSKRYFETAMPPVLSSLWRAPDGRVGLVACNIGATTRAVTLSFELPAGCRATPRVLYQPEGGAPPVVVRKNDTTARLSCTLPPRTAAAFAFSPATRN